MEEMDHSKHHSMLSIEGLFNHSALMVGLVAASQAFWAVTTGVPWDPLGSIVKGFEHMAGMFAPPGTMEAMHGAAEVAEGAAQGAAMTGHGGEAVTMPAECAEGGLATRREWFAKCLNPDQQLQMFNDAAHWDAPIQDFTDGWSYPDGGRTPANW